MLGKNLIYLSSRQELLSYVIKEVVGKLGFLDCVIYEFDNSKNELIQVAAHGDKSKDGKEIINAITIPLGQGITGSVAKSGEAVIIQDTLKDKRYIRDLNPWASEICVPIIKDNKVWGVIDCEHPEKNFFTSHHLELLSTIAKMLAARISDWENLEKLSQTQKDLLKTQKELQESEEKYRRLFEYSEDPMIITQNGKSTISNNAAVFAFNFDSKEEMYNLDLRDASPPKQPDGRSSKEKADQMAQMAMEYGFHRFEWMFRRVGGEDFPMEVTLTKIPFEGEDALFAVCRDITQRKKMEFELNTALQKANEANQSKSNFLTNISHELRTPLNAIIGFSELIRDQILGKGGEAHYTEYAGDINNAGNYLLNLINDILDVSTLDAKERKAEKANVNIHDLVANTQTIMGKALTERNENYFIEIPENIPPVFADKRCLQQILINLINNAVKFTPVHKPITLRVEEVMKGHVFSIIDEGCGIPEKALATITNRFDRGNVSSLTPIEGTGLGLAIVEGLVELHDGRLWIESKVDVGTTVSFFIPKT